MLSTKIIFTDTVNKPEYKTFQNNLIRTVLSLAVVELVFFIAAGTGI